MIKSWWNGFALVKNGDRSFYEECKGGVEYYSN